VQRVMENLRIYGVRFGAAIVTVEPNLHRPTPLGVSVAPASLEQAQSSPTN